ncbi:MAG: winged helix-turn-helix domain-containing protein, partial [Acidobacteriota bacterium]|nr:winged helix-turn-helix domain-containing protein [Acidobacteriota bacterium]
MKFYEFEDFRIDLGERVLYRDGSPVSLTPKVFDVLLALAARQGRVVSKENLMEEIWRDATVEESNLTQNIFTLRRALGEKAGGQKFIETVSRRGYRFLPEVRIVELADESSEKIESREEFEGDEAIQTSQVSSSPNDAKQQIFAVTPRSQISNRPVLFFSLIALIVVTSLGFALRYEWRENALASNSKETKLRRLTDNGNLSGAAISPDGNLLAYVEVEGKNNSIRLKNIQTESEVVVVPPSESPLASPSFSPDGNFIYYSYIALNTNAKVFQIPVFGGESRQIAADLWGNFSVSLDGKQIAFPRENRVAKKTYIVIAATDGSGERIVATREHHEFFELWGPAPAWSPDGEHLTVDAKGFGEDKSHLIEINLQTGAERELKTQIAWRYIERLA